MRFGLEEHIITELNEVFEANPKVDKAFIFGSRAKGNYRPDSDIDITIKGSDITLDDILKMQVAFEEKDINFKIDLVHYDTIKEKALIEHIDRVGIEIYSRWKECKLGELVDLNCRTIGKDYQYDTIEYLDTGSITQNKIEGYQYFKINQIPSRARRLVQTNDIIYSTVRPIQRHYGFIENPNPNLVVSTGFVVITAKQEKANSKYLYYWLSSDDVVGFLDSIAEGSTSAYPSLRPDDINQLDITVPPLSEQTFIAEILSSLDNKIDLLHRQNKTLEQLAETLFRQWFVENANESWSEKSLHEIADHYKENIHPFKFPNKYFHHFSLPAFDDGKYPKAELGSEILSNKYKVIPYSILISKLNPRFPRIWELFGNDIPENSICSTEFQVVKPKELKYFAFIYYYLKSNEVTQELASAAGGTSGSHQRVSPDDIFNLSFLMPPIDLIEKFDSITKEQLGKIKSNTLQIQTLTKLRDTLLPKLMNGEVRINLGDSRLTNPSKNKKANVRQ